MLKVYQHNGAIQLVNEALVSPSCNTTLHNLLTTDCMQDPIVSPVSSPYQTAPTQPFPTSGPALHRLAVASLRVRPVVVVQLHHSTGLMDVEPRVSVGLGNWASHIQQAPIM